MSPSEWPEIIQAAAKTPIGAMSLLALLLSSVALAFFRREGVAVKLGVFLLLFIGASGFGYALLSVPADAAAPPPKPSPPAPSSTDKEDRILRLEIEIDQLNSEIDSKQRSYIDISALADASRRSCLGIGEGKNPSQCTPWQQRKAEAEQLAEELTSLRRQRSDAKARLLQLQAS